MSALARIVGFGQSTPPRCDQDDLWEHYSSRYADPRGVAERIWRRSGVQARCLTANPLREDVSGWSTAERMRRFASDAIPLAKEAVTACLASADLPSEQVSQLTTVSCTGYGNPGIDVHLAGALGMSPGLRRLTLGHMGCYAAIPGLATAAEHVAVHRRPAVLVCTELTSLHLQPPPHESEQAVAHALFADACAAVVLAAPDDPRPGLDLLGIESLTDTTAADDMTWDITDQGFRMTLSPRVPDAVGRHLPTLLQRLLGPHRLRVADVVHWAVHPGGPRVIDSAQQAMGLADSQVAHSRSVLARYGNCSSPTVLLTLAQTTPADGEHVVALAFGPGLTVTGALLRASGPQR
jgi:alkylresorcinol/alkylpyrone synthase